MASSVVSSQPSSLHIHVPSSSLAPRPENKKGGITSTTNGKETMYNKSHHGGLPDSTSSAPSFEFDSVNVQQNYINDTDDDEFEITQPTEGNTISSSQLAKHKETIKELRREILKLTVQRNHAKEQNESLEKKVSYWEDRCYSLQAAAMLNVVGTNVGGGGGGGLGNGVEGGGSVSVGSGLSPNHPYKPDGDINNASTRVTSGSAHPSFTSADGGPMGNIITIDYQGNSIRSYSNYFGASAEIQHPNQSTIKGGEGGAGGGNNSINNNTRRPSEIEGNNNKSAFTVVGGSSTLGNNPNNSGPTSPTAATAAANTACNFTNAARKRDSTASPALNPSSESLNGTQSSVALADTNASQQNSPHQRGCAINVAAGTANNNQNTTSKPFSNTNLQASMNHNNPINGTHTPTSIAESSNATMSTYNNNASILRGGAATAGWGAASPLGHTQQMLAAALGGVGTNTSVSEEKRIIRALKIKLKNASTDISNYQKEIEILNKQIQELRNTIEQGNQQQKTDPQNAVEVVSKEMSGNGSPTSTTRDRSSPQNFTTNSAALVGGLGSLVREMEKDSQLRHLIATYKAESERLRERVAELEARQQMMVPYPGWLMTEEEMQDLMNTTQLRTRQAHEEDLYAGGSNGVELAESKGLDEPKNYKPTFILGSSTPTTPNTADLKAPTGHPKSKNGSRLQSPSSLSLVPPPLTQFTPSHPKSATTATDGSSTVRPSAVAAVPMYHRSSSGTGRRPSSPARKAVDNNTTTERPVIRHLNPFTDTPKRAPPPAGRQSPAYRSQLLLESTNVGSGHTNNNSRTASPVMRSGVSRSGSAINTSRGGGAGGLSNASAATTSTAVGAKKAVGSRYGIGTAPPSSTRSTGLAVPPQHISGSNKVSGSIPSTPVNNSNFGLNTTGGRPASGRGSRTQSPLSTPRGKVTATASRSNSVGGRKVDDSMTQNRMPSPIARPATPTSQQQTDVVPRGGPTFSRTDSKVNSSTIPPIPASNFQRGFSTGNASLSTPTSTDPSLTAVAAAARPTKVSAIRDTASEAFTTPSGKTTTYHPTRMVRHHEWEQPEERM